MTTYGQRVPTEAAGSARPRALADALGTVASRRPGHLRLVQGSPQWLEARRALVTATDIPVLLGLSPYKSEAQLAIEKAGGEPAESTVRMRIGTALEPLIADEYTRATGRAVRRFRGLVVHPRIDWAAASPDGRTVGERRLVELKWSASKSRWADGLPQDIEAQVAWQLGVTGYPAADVAVLLGDDLRIFDVAHDPVLFERLVAIAADFRRRLAEGGPMADNAASLKARYPADNGAEMAADAELAEAVKALITTRARRKALESDEEALETAIKSRMGEVSRLTGDGFSVTWRKAKDTEVINWPAIADGLLRQLPETERAALVGLQTTVREGARYFRVVWQEDNE